MPCRRCPTASSSAAVRWISTPPSRTSVTTRTRAISSDSPRTSAFGRGGGIITAAPSVYRRTPTEPSMKEAYPMARHLYLDLETRSRTDVKMGVYRYATDPEFGILMAAYSLDGGPVQLAVGDAEIRQQLAPYLADPQWLKVAHNAAFERVCLSV